MTFQYFKNDDMLYIKLISGVSTESEEVAPGIVIDYDDNNKVIGIEIEYASKITNLSRLELFSMPIVDMVLKEKAPAEFAD
jgi:uncharacterized protein YuzE